MDDFLEVGINVYLCGGGYAMGIYVEVGIHPEISIERQLMMGR